MKSKKLRKTIIAAAVLAAAVSGSALVMSGCSGCNDGNSDSNITQEQKITVTVSGVTNGTVTCDKTEYLSGDDVTVTITPDAGYQLGSVKVNDVDKTAQVKGGVLVLDDVTENITVTVTFAARTAATASVSVKENKGGLASFDATSGYVGDTVRLSVSADKGYEVSSVLINGVEKISELTGSSLELVLPEGGITAVVEFYAFPIIASVTCGNYFETNVAAYGTATILNAKETYTVEDTFEVEITPDTGKVIKSVSINGSDVTDSVSNNKLTVDLNDLNTVGNVAISVVFDLPSKELDFTVTTNKFGAEIPVGGVTATLTETATGRFYNDVQIDNDGKIETEVAEGTYSMQVDGYTAAQIETASVGNSVVLTYLPFGTDSYGYSGRDTQGWDTSAYGTSSGISTTMDWSSVHFKDDFGDFVMTVTLKKASVDAYQAYGVRIGDKIYGLSIAHNSQGVRFPNKDLETRDFWGSDAKWIGSDGTSGTYWDCDLRGFTDAQKSAFTSANGLKLTVVRKGTSLVFFFGEEVYLSYTVPETKANVAIANGNKPSTHYIEMNTTATELAKYDVQVSATSNDTEYGTVALDKADGKYALGQEVTVTVTPAAGTDTASYVLKSLKVDNKPVTLDGTSYTFTATKTNYAIKAEFEMVSLATVTLTISSDKFGKNVPPASITLTGGGLTKTIALTNGSATVEKLPVDIEYTLSADGYDSASFTHSSGNTTQNLTMKYQPFGADQYGIAGRGDWNTDNFGGTNSSISTTSPWSAKHFKDSFDDFVMTVTIKQQTGVPYQGYAVRIGGTIYGVIVRQNTSKIRVPANEYVQSGDPDFWRTEAKWANYTKTGNGAYWDDALKEIAYTDGDVIKIVRKGSLLVFIVKGEIFLSYTVSETDKASIAITNGQTASTHYVTLNTSQTALDEQVKDVTLNVTCANESANVPLKEVTLISSGYSRTFAVVEGKVQADKLPLGVSYKVVAGCYNIETFTHNGTEQNLNMTYNPFGTDVFGGEVGRGNSWNTSTYDSDGYITGAGGWSGKYYAGGFNDFVLTVKISLTADGHEGYGIRIGNTIYGFTLNAATDKNEINVPVNRYVNGDDFWKKAAEWANWSNGNDGDANSTGAKTTKVTDGQVMTIVRKGTSLVFFLGDKVYNEYTVPDTIAAIAITGLKSGNNRYDISMDTTDATVDEWAAKIDTADRMTF